MIYEFQIDGCDKPIELSADDVINFNRSDLVNIAFKNNSEKTPYKIREIEYDLLVISNTYLDKITIYLEPV